MTAKPHVAEASILGVVFDAEPLGAERARFRAWQMWMERLDPAEMRNAALYDGALLLQGNHQIVVIAVSGSPAVIAYVRDAFAAPDLAAFTGIAPISHRFLDEQSLPRERLVLRGYINDQHAFVAQQDEGHLIAIARHAEWLVVDPPAPPVAPAAPSRPAAMSPEQMARVETVTMQATKLDGATQVMMRLWRVSSSSRRAADRRRRVLFGTLGTALILLAVGIIVFKFATQLQARGLNKHPTVTPAKNAVLMVVAPLSLQIPCQPGSPDQFIISNNGTGDFTWTSNGTRFAPLLAMSAANGTLAGGDSQVVIVTASQRISAKHVATLLITDSSGGTARVTLNYGGCAP